MENAIAHKLSLFGFTPDKVWARLNNRTAPKILSNSIPKSGTHLLERLLYLLPGIYRQPYRTLCDDGNGLFNLKKQCSRLKNGQFIVSHLFYDDEYVSILNKSGVKVILMIRDPRDIVISNVHYITRINKKHRLHDHFLYHLKNEIERLHFCIKGSIEPAEYSIGSYLEKFYPWVTNEQVLTVRFKDLIGAKGGGTEKVQTRTIEEVLSFIGVKVTPEEKEELAARVFSPSSKTFHKGRTRQWEEIFEEEDKKLFKEVAGDWLIKYGYERDHNW